MISNATLQRYTADPAAFRAEQLVDVNGNVHRFSDVMDDWQRQDFAALTAGLMLCNGRSTNANCIKRAYLERPRGHSKTTDIGSVATWAYAFASRPIRGYAFAADRDQATLLKDSIQTNIRLNPWLGEVLEVQKSQVVNIAKGHPGFGASLEIAASDVGSSYGILPDLIIADEVTHWPEAGERLWHSIISSAAKRSNCFLLCIANAGMIDSWQWNVRETARMDDAWYFSRLDGPKASWITPERLAEQQRMLPKMAYSRLWENCWSSSGGDALTPEVIDAAFISELSPVTKRQDGWLYIAGVDLGITRDASAVVVLAIPTGGGAGKIRLVHHKMWIPIGGQKIDLLDVEAHLLKLDEMLGLECIAFDSYEMIHLAQTLEADTNHKRRNQRKFFKEPWLRDIQPTPSNLRQQASLTIEYFNDHRIQLYECEPLRRDLHKLRVEEKSYGFRLVSPRDGEGHGDSFSAFAVALLVASELSVKKPVILRDMFKGSGNPHDNFQRRQQEYAEEQERMLQRRDDPTNGLRDAVRERRLFIG